MDLRDRLKQMLGHDRTPGTEREPETQRVPGIEGESSAAELPGIERSPEKRPTGSGSLENRLTGQSSADKKTNAEKIPLRNQEPGSSFRDNWIPGEEVNNSEGSFWLRTSDVPIHDRHGFHILGRTLEVDPNRLADATGDHRLKDFHAGNAIYLDTETTSLSQGAGVYVFMIGIGFFTIDSNQDDVFRIEQYFMRDYDEEPAMLKAFNDRVRDFEGMVSFFGKNFDQYRIQDRMAFMGFPDELPVDRHLDLYHLSRRLYKDRFENLKLKTLETRLLGFHRQNDIPGAECPEAYFSFLEGRDRGRMAEVFEHNLWDILSLATLCTEVDELVRNPATAHDKYALACALMKNGLSRKGLSRKVLSRKVLADCVPHESRILSLLKDALEEMTAGPESFDARFRRVILLKRNNRLGELEEELHALVEQAPENPDALTEMAKFCEHRSRDFQAALEYAQRALDSLRRWDTGTAQWAQKKEAGKYRILRLERKCKSSQS